MLHRTLWAWFPFAVVTTMTAAIAYGLTQQSLRQSANDAPDALSAEVANSLMSGTALDTTTTEDISQSLLPFFVVYDSNGTALQGTGTLNGALPTLPSGVLANAQTMGVDRITWQPQSGVRIAAVVRSVSSGNGQFVLAGQSLARTEVHESQAWAIALLGWVATLAASFFAVGAALVALDKHR